MGHDKQSEGITTKENKQLSSLQHIGEGGRRLSTTDRNDLATNESEVKNIGGYSKL